MPRLPLFAAVPLCLLLAGCWVNVPCPESGENAFARYFEPGDPEQVIQVGVSTKSQVRNLLDRPHVECEGNQIWWYSDTTTKSVDLALPFLLAHGGGVQTQHRYHYLFLAFDDRGVLRHYKLCIDNEEPHIREPYTTGPTWRTALDEFLAEVAPMGLSTPWNWKRE